ncbi:HAD family phosphatase [Cohnella pontilimi]|uniref:HAD family phosphatase n=1 Tax=Cohnella pontilimi TaxID=2564100 RepID=A0A4U0FD89_9BACL|nr:Cof-type HAD-IIB family hydrolase [Cohnella pontilimi]TJY42883.1 HAD family phosphatase [Cohnella pontilimi]
MVKLVALDIDGTLLNRNGQISGRTLRAVAGLRRAGVEFTLCTGRNLPLVREFAQSMAITLPIAICNGGEVRGVNGEVLERRSIPIELAKEAYRILVKHEALFDIYWNDRILIESKPKHLQRLIDYYRAIKNIDNEYEALLEQEIEAPYMFETHDISAWMDSGEPAAIEKFFVMEHRPERLEAMYDELKKVPGLNVFTSHHTTLEINHVTADKGAGLARIAEAYGVAAEEVAAIGDGMNDVPMFAYAGISVAMGNASDEVKRHARFVTGTNAEDGLAQTLEQWL